MARRKKQLTMARREEKMKREIGEVWKDKFLPSNKQWRVQTKIGTLHIAFGTKHEAIEAAKSFMDDEIQLNADFYYRNSILNDEAWL